MAQWPPFDEAFPALVGDWQASLRHALRSNDGQTVSDICSELGVLCIITGEVPSFTFSKLVWLLRSGEARSSVHSHTVMHFFTVNQHVLTEEQKSRIAWRLTRWGEPGIAEMVFDPLAGLH